MRNNIYGLENSITVALEGEIDHHAARRIRERLDSIIAEKRPKTLILDFSGVTFMDSSGIGLVLGRHRQMGFIGGQLKITELPPRIAKMMSMSGVTRLGIIEEVILDEAN